MLLGIYQVLEYLGWFITKEITWGSSSCLSPRLVQKKHVFGWTQDKVIQKGTHNLIRMGFFVPFISQIQLYVKNWKKISNAYINMP